MADLPIHIDHQGNERKLSLLPPTAACGLLRASARSLSAITPIIPRANWTECDYTAGHPIDLILNQKSFGQCVAGSCAGANARMRYVRTGKIEIPSMAWIYDQINGGQDNGAVITDAQRVMLSTGAPTVDKYSVDPKFRAAPMPADSVVLKEDEAILIDTPEDIATALLSLGGFSQHGINVTNSFEHFTGAGVAWNGKLPPGGSNHSVYAAGLKNINGQWFFVMVNDWDKTWGPWSNGTCLIPVDAIDTGGWLHLSNADSDNTPPPPVS